MNAAGFSAAKTPANPAFSNASVCALICAGGKGTRAGFNKNKLLKDVLGIPVLERTMAAFAAAGADEIVVAASIFPKSSLFAVSTEPRSARAAPRVFSRCITRWRTYEAKSF